MNNGTHDNENRQTRVATYARVSTQEQASEGTSLAFQDSQLSGYCQLQNWTLVNSYVDPGFSGKDGNRPGLERMLADARIGLFDKVVIHKLDRLARNLKLLLEIEQQLRNYGVSLVSMKESVDTSSSTGKMIFQLFGMVAEWERANIVERGKNGRLQRYREGSWGGGKAPYGYSYDKPTHKLVIKESEARIVRRMYSEYAAGKSLSGICQSLNHDHIPARAKKAKGWWQTSVRQVLLNPAYKGTEVVNRHTHISLINKMDLSKAITFSVPVIVTEQVWQIAQDRMSGNKHVKPNKQGKHLLQGMITCAKCGYGFASKNDYYFCRGKMKYVHPDGSPRCQSRHIQAGWLDNEVWKRIEETVNDPDKLFHLIAESIQNLKAAEADLSARIKPIDDRLAEIAEQKARLADDWITRHLNIERFKELKDSMNKEETRMRNLRVEIDPAQILELEQTRSWLNFWERRVRDLKQNSELEEGILNPHKFALKFIGLEAAEMEKMIGFPTSRRQLLDKLQVKLSVCDDKVDVKCIFPVEPIDVQMCTSTRGDTEGIDASGS